ncbi:DNA repair protein RecN [Candidatus Neomarinimicrobiota bacterium]
MINNLFIKDFAILDQLEIDFKSGLTIITGETGSGKSIILQALNVALGGKVSKEMVRSQSTKAVIEARIDSTIYRRLLNNNGRTKSYKNEEPQKEIYYKNHATKLVDFHGQHEQQLIMNQASHIQYLDNFCDSDILLDKIAKVYFQINEKNDLLSKKIIQNENAKEQKELKSFQLQEILSVNPNPDEDENLENEFRTLSHIDELIETIHKLNQILVEDDHSIYVRCADSIKELTHIAKYDSKIEPFIDSLNEASVKIQDVVQGLSNHIQTINHDKDQLKEIENRIYALDGLKRKYGGTIRAILDFKNGVEFDLEQISNLDSDIHEIENEISILSDEYQELADALHTNRAFNSKILSSLIEQEMKHLHMPGAEFEINISQRPVSESIVKLEDKAVQAYATGYDDIEFFLSANPGEELKPLVAIASGGEISRIMLAIKTVLQNNDPVNTLVFDEIDTGISGIAAEKVGKSLKKLAKSKQVICITHLPQIAELAENHLHVTKIITDSNTRVSVKYIDSSEGKKIIKQLSSNSTSN